ncbi:TIR domain-containing protein [Chloroflexota bacterium]
MNEIEKQNTVKELNNFYKDLRNYKNRQLKKPDYGFSQAQKRSLDSLRLKLQREHGRLDGVISKYVGTGYMSGFAPLGGPYTGGPYVRHEVFGFSLGSLDMYSAQLEGLDLAISLVNKAIGKLVSTPIAELDVKDVGETEPPTAFIAHEGETKALDKLKSFLDALGVTYFIAEIEPSDGKQVEGQVDWVQGQADFAIILATKGKVVDKKTSKPQIGTNVADELGRARKVFKNQIILLIQAGVEVHTNVSGIVHERFTHQSMDKAFIKIVRELTNWGFITTRTTKE